MKKEREIEVEKNIRRCKEDVIFDTIIFIILTALLLIVAYPLWWVIISSISDPKAVSGGQVVWYPVGLTFRGYLEVFEDKLIVRSIGYCGQEIPVSCGPAAHFAGGGRIKSAAAWENDSGPSASGTSSGGV